jgi:glucose-1-phosphate adenylyltransferase
MGIYVFGTRFLADVLRRDAFASRSTHDFGADILPSLVRETRVFAYALRGRDGERPYWRDVGTPAAYWRAQLELLDVSPSLRLDDSMWPVLTGRRAPKLTSLSARSGRGSCEKSLVAEDCEVGGTVRRSVLFSGVRVSGDAVVEDSVVLPGAVIGRNCRLRGAIIDSDCHVPDGTVIEGGSLRRHAGESGEPIVVTAEGLGPNSACSWA